MRHCPDISAIFLDVQGCDNGWLQVYDTQDPFRMRLLCAVPHVPVLAMVEQTGAGEDKFIKLVTGGECRYKL